MQSCVLLLAIIVINVAFPSQLDVTSDQILSNNNFLGGGGQTSLTPIRFFTHPAAGLLRHNMTDLILEYSTAE